ncbi:hypothetical protein HDU93_003421, partial [Gonapodya sp. JEL0774]
MAMKIAKIPFTPVLTNLKSHTLANGTDFYTINPKGAVPALVVDGMVLTENIAVLTYIADLAPKARLIGKIGTWERYRTLESLSEVATDLHGSFGPLFNPKLQGDARDMAVEKLQRILKRYDSKLGGQKWFTKELEEPTVADFYAAVVLGWAGSLKVDLSNFVDLVRFNNQFSSLPGIAEARAEWLAGGP